MNFSDYQSLSASGLDFGIDTSLSVSDFNGYCSVNGWMSLPVLATSPKYKRNELYRFDLTAHIPSFVFLATTADCKHDFSSASEFLVSAFLRDSTLNDRVDIESGTYTFRSSYVVLKVSDLGVYESNYMDSSDLWGFFYHNAVTLGGLLFDPGKTRDAIAGLTLPTPDHRSVLRRRNIDSSTLGAYYSTYHLLELSFDYDYVTKIQGLGTDLKNIGKLLITYSHSETVRLHSLVERYWSDESSLAIALEKFFAPSVFDAQIDELLFDYQKTGFPWNFKDDAAKRSVFSLTARTSFTRASFSRAKIEWSLEKLQAAVSYIVYRFRCAIVHATIGEYIISIDDEQLVEEKAMPLLNELVSHVYR